MSKAETFDFLKLEDEFKKLLGLEEKPEAHKIWLKEGERRVLSILFLDLQGYTELSDRLDPEEVRTVVGNTLKVMTREISRYGGVVHEYTGDGFLAVFGLKKVFEDDAVRAILAGLGMLERLKDINSIIADTAIKISVRIGINTGLVAFEKVIDRITLSGDAVNVASRLEANAPANQILVSQATRDAAGEYFIYESQQPLVVKGKNKPLAVHTVIGLNPKQPKRWERPRLARLSEYVGRGKESKIISDLFAKVRDESLSHVIFITGETGIGKSRLLHEFRSKSNDRKKSGFWVDGYCRTVNPNPLWVFTTVIYDLLKAPVGSQISASRWETFCDDVLSGSKKDAERVRKVIGFLVGIEYPDFCPKEMRASDVFKEMAAAWSTLLEGLARYVKRSGIAPLAIAIDDIHWIDPDSEKLIAAILKTLSERTLFFILSRSDEKLSELCKNRENVTHIALEPLSKDLCEKIVRDAVPSLDLPPAILNEIVRKSDGNPFFIEEMIETLVDQGAIQRVGQNWKWNEDVKSVLVPKSIYAVLLSRIDALEESVRKTVQLSSVIGQEFSLWALRDTAAKLGIHKDVLLHHLEVLEENRLILSQVGKEHIYSFRHALTRDVAYQTILNHNKLILHGAVADVFEKHYKGRVDYPHRLVAEHWELANEAKNASTEYLAAGKYSLNAGMMASAVECFNKAESLTSDPIIQAEAHCGFGDVREVTGKYDDAAARFKKGIEILESASDESSSLLKAGINQRIARIHERKGEKNVAQSFLKKALNLVADNDSDDGRLTRAQIYQLLGWLAYTSNNFEEAAKMYELGMKTIADPKFNYTKVKGMLHNTLGILNRAMGDSRQSIKNQEMNINIRKKICDRRGECAGYINLGAIYYQTGDYKRAMSCNERAFEMKREIGEREGEAICLANLGNIAFELGEYSKAESNLRAAIDIFEQINSLWALPDAYFYLSKVLINTKRTAKCKRLIEKAEELAIQNKSLKYLAMIEALKAELAEACSDIEDALRHCKDAEMLFSSQRESFEYGVFCLYFGTLILKALKSGVADFSEQTAKEYLDSALTTFTKFQNATYIKRAQAVLKGLP